MYHESSQQDRHHRYQGQESNLDWDPVGEIEEEEEHYVISLEIPGVSKDRTRIEFGNNRLTISGTRHTSERQSLRRQERYRDAYLFGSSPDQHNDENCSDRESSREQRSRQSTSAATLSAPDIFWPG